MRKTNSGARSNQGTLVVELQQLGFTDYEAKAYLALLSRSAPSTSYEISKFAGIPRANAYSVLESLAGKRAVRPVSKSPLRYMPMEPDVLLGRIVEETKQQCRELSGKLTSLRSDEAADDYVWPITGEFQVNSKIRTMIDNAKRHVWIKAHESALQPHSAALQRAAQRGVQVLIILFGSQVEKFEFGANCRIYLHEGNGIAVGIGHELITLTRDFTEALMANLGDNPYGAYTLSRPVVNMADTMIRHEIYLAEIFRNLGSEIETIFGPALYKLRRQYLPREQSKSLERILVSNGLLTDSQVSKQSRAEGTRKE